MIYMLKTCIQVDNMFNIVKTNDMLMTNCILPGETTHQQLHAVIMASTCHQVKRARIKSSEDQTIPRQHVFNMYAESKV